MNWPIGIAVFLLLALLFVYPFYFLEVKGQRQQRHGPSIVTLVLWLATGIIFAAMIIPQFLTFSLRSKQIVAKHNLGALYTAQVAYHGERGEYAGGSQAFTALNWSPEGYEDTDYLCGNDIILATYRHWDDYQLGPWPFPVRPSTTRDSFLCLSVSNLDNDPFLDVWSINEKNEIVNVLDDVTDRDRREPDPRRFTLYAFVAVLALFLASIGRDTVRIRRYKPADRAEPKEGERPTAPDC